MYGKIKLRNIPKSILITILTFILWICAYFAVRKEEAIAWNKMVAEEIKNGCTCDDDLDEDCTCISDWD